MAARARWRSGWAALGPSFEACRERLRRVPGGGGRGGLPAERGLGPARFRARRRRVRPRGPRALRHGVPDGTRRRLVRFEAKGEACNRSVALSQIAEACLAQAGAAVVGMVLVGETDGLVGAALRRSPVGMAAGLDPFAHPDVREWLSMTSEPEHSREHGAGRRGGDPRGGPGARARSSGRLSGARRRRPPGAFPRGGRPVSPAARAAASRWPRRSSSCSSPGRVETVLHLLGDSRPIVGAGESTFTAAGFVWYVSPERLERRGQEGRHDAARSARGRSG